MGYQIIQKEQFKTWSQDPEIHCSLSQVVTIHTLHVAKVSLQYLKIARAGRAVSQDSDLGLNSSLTKFSWHWPSWSVGHMPMINLTLQTTRALQIHRENKHATQSSWLSYFLKMEKTTPVSPNGDSFQVLSRAHLSHFTSPHFSTETDPMTAIAQEASTLLPLAHQKQGSN